MRFEESEGWTQRRLTQAEAALLLGQCERSCRHIERFEADGLKGLLDEQNVSVLNPVKFPERAWDFRRRYVNIITLD